METKTHSKYVIAFDLGGTSLKYGYGNKKEGLVFFDTIHHDDKSLEGLKRLFVSVIDTLLETKNDIVALCLASPGAINSDGMILGSTPNIPFLSNVNLKDLLYEIIKVPIFIENDANIMAFAEYSNHYSKSILGITIGTGIGSGFIFEDKIFRGESFMAMEAGHTIIVPGGRECLCGKRGCFEAYCSAESIKRIICEQFPDLTNMSIGDILSHRCIDIKKIIYEILDYFALALSNLIMILNPGAVVIGGGVTEIEAFDFEHLKKKVYSYLTSEFRNCEIKKAVYGNKAGVVGGIMYCEMQIENCYD
jgi:glucokinase